jgi:hypothetical protein
VLQNWRISLVLSTVQRVCRCARMHVVAYRWEHAPWRWRHLRSMDCRNICPSQRLRRAVWASSLWSRLPSPWWHSRLLDSNRNWWPVNKQQYTVLFWYSGPRPTTWQQTFHYSVLKERASSEHKCYKALFLVTWQRVVTASVVRWSEFLLQNGDVMRFMWGTNWIYICYVEESRPPLWSSSWLQNGYVRVLCLLWGRNMNLYMLCRRN